MIIKKKMNFTKEQFNQNYSLFDCFWQDDSEKCGGVVAMQQLHFM